MSNSWDHARILYGYNQPRTLNEAIEKFLSALELTDRQSDLVSRRQNAVRAHAAKNSVMDIENSLLIGSYPRETQIKPIDFGKPALDVDALLILGTTEWNLNKYWRVKDGGTALIKDTFKALQDYPGAKVEIDRPSITVRWSDMKMELTPAFNREGGGYIIPAKDITTSKWTETSPLADARHLTQANKDCGNELKPMIKMLKCLNRHQGNFLGSFGVETLAYHSARYDYKGFAFEMPYFFDKLLENENKFIAPPSGVGAELFIYLGIKRSNVENARFNLRRAFAAAETGNHQLAIQIMGSVFGKPFPGA